MYTVLLSGTKALLVVLRIGELTSTVLLVVLMMAATSSERPVPVPTLTALLVVLIKGVHALL